jgi:hypothetical protein
MVLHGRSGLRFSDQCYDQYYPGGTFLKIDSLFSEHTVSECVFIARELYSANHFLLPDNDSTEAAAILF